MRMQDKGKQTPRPPKHRKDEEEDAPREEQEMTRSPCKNTKILNQPQSPNIWKGSPLQSTQETEAKPWPICLSLNDS
jgi:hypothetical protein